MRSLLGQREAARTDRRHVWGRSSDGRTQRSIGSPHDGTRAREITYEADDMVGELMEAREFNALLEEAAADA